MSSPMLNIALKAAKAACTIMNRASENISGLEVHKKAHHDYVSEVDVACERTIVDILREAYPNHQILAEESGLTGPEKSQYQWIIDPLDGTTNYLHGFPQYAVSIALKRENEIVEAVVADPVANEIFTATRGVGAFLNGRRLRVSKRTSMSEALVGTGFPFRRNDNVDAFVKVFKEVAQATSGLRRAGAASLDLAYVAAGRLDAFWEPNLKSWDIAAGSLLVLEAGGLVTDFKGESDYLTTGQIVAGTPKIFGQLLPIVHRNYGEIL
ncbi:MAG TPA: inositol monophosphatase [Candidatus Aphodousia gallistercoris]|nr:inositol monophosphatase [Candidatus Aphodousia gallistercoris]